uniref:Uncharacterized protein n=1 Tax=Cucumis sativus TaxID=3659 RepID=A0A0A0LMR4_CUCSA
MSVNHFTSLDSATGRFQNSLAMLESGTPLALNTSILGAINSENVCKTRVLCVVQNNETIQSVDPKKFIRKSKHGTIFLSRLLRRICGSLQIKSTRKLPDMPFLERNSNLGLSVLSGSARRSLGCLQKMLAVWEGVNP